MFLEGKIAVVTGGAMGIGFETSKLLAKEGATVAVFDINESAFNETVKSLGGNLSIVYFNCDVTDKTQVYSRVEEVLKKFGRIDILINNAGYVKGGSLITHDDEVWEKTIDVNLTSLIYMIKAVLPSMMERNSGHIINISSASAFLGVADLSVYSATKWAVWGLTESMRFETYNAGKKGIYWSSIHPSYIATGMFEGAKLGLLGNLIVPRVKSHSQIARAIVYGAIKKRKYAVRRPVTLRLAIILRGILPDYLFQKMMLVMGVHTSMKHWKGR